MAFVLTDASNGPEPQYNQWSILYTLFRKDKPNKFFFDAWTCSTKMQTKITPQNC